MNKDIEPTKKKHPGLIEGIRAKVRSIFSPANQPGSDQIKQSLEQQVPVGTTTEEAPLEISSPEELVADFNEQVVYIKSKIEVNGVSYPFEAEGYNFRDQDPNTNPKQLIRVLLIRLWGDSQNPSEQSYTALIREVQDIDSRLPAKFEIMAATPYQNEGVMSGISMRDIGRQINDIFFKLNEYNQPVEESKRSIEQVVGELTHQVESVNSDRRQPDPLENTELSNQLADLYQRMISQLGLETREASEYDLLLECSRFGKTIPAETLPILALADEFSYIGRDELGNPVILIGENFRSSYMKYRVYLAYEADDPNNPTAGGKIVIIKQGEADKDVVALLEGINLTVDPAASESFDSVRIFEESVKPPLTPEKLEEFKRVLSGEIGKIKKQRPGATLTS